MQMTGPALAFQTTQIFQQATRIALGNIISRVGLPKGAIANSVIDILGNFDPENAAETLLRGTASSLEAALQKLTSKLLSEALDAGVGLAIDAAAVVPVAGWIVSICWSIGGLIYKLIQQRKTDPYNHDAPTAQNSRFSPAVDKDVLNLVLGKLATTDWTSLFYPPSAGKSQSWKETIYVEELIDGGVRFIGGAGGPDWIGFVPGTGWLHRAIELPGKTRLPQTPMVAEVGKTMLPSSQQQCLWLWSHLAQTNSPATFCVHADSAAKLWQVYIDDLRAAISETKLIDGPRRKMIFAMYDRTESGTVFGWGDGKKQAEYAPVKLLSTLRKRQLAFCKTLTVAYVDTSFAALTDPDVKAAVETYQRELLEHPAVCDVDLTNVPDVLYAEEIRSRRKHHNCIVYGGDKFVATTEKPPEIVAGFAMPPGESHPAAAAVSSGPSGLQIAGAAAALLGGILLLRR
jgi:hypothetical protein